MTILSKSKPYRLLQFIGLMILFVAQLSSAQAGVFMIPKFINPGSNAIGIEPEVTFTNGAGLAANLKYQQGLTELSNLFLVAGIGTGVKKLKLGGGLSFDFFPDIDRQPGIGVAFQGIYNRLTLNNVDVGQFNLETTPYLHKAFSDAEGRQVEPYLAIPLVMQFRSGTYDFGMTAAVGAMFREKALETTFLLELGVDITKTDTYLSGGVIFYP